MKKRKPKARAWIWVWRKQLFLRVMLLHCDVLRNPNLSTDFREAVLNYCDTTSSIDLVPKLHQEALHLDTNMETNFLFIQYNLIQHKTTLILFM